MNDLPWLNIVLLLLAALSALLVSGLALRAHGAARWAEQVRTHTRTLEAGGVGAWPPSPARFDAQELDGLPAPVQRYFLAALTHGQPFIASAGIAMAGRMNMSASAEQWKPFASQQRIFTRRPGFLWDAAVQMFPGVPVHVEDSYFGGQGRLLARLFGLFTVADQHGEGEIARGEFMRYFAETPWYPTALLPSQGVRWAAVDATSANATVSDGPLSLTLLFRFNSAGLIASVHAEARGASVGNDGAMTLLPWDCGLSDYQRHDGMLIPMYGEAAWVRPEGRKVYFVGRVKRLAYRFRS
jgi:hypothetical protein